MRKKKEWSVLFFTGLSPHENDKIKSILYPTGVMVLFHFRGHNASMSLVYMHYLAIL